MVRQNDLARQYDYTFLSTASQIERFVREGYLQPVRSTADLVVNDGVSYPFARPEMHLFLQRLGKQHREACGAPLVVTSLTRPRHEQPRNSHALSVHPTGMAVDLRVRREAACVDWLESMLLALERQGVLDVTREHRPPHFHVALFTQEYRDYVQPLLRRDSLAAVARARSAARVHAAGHHAPPQPAEPALAAAAGGKPDRPAPMALAVLLAIPLVLRMRRR